MNTEFFTALDLLESEKGISKEYMLEKVEAALLAAYKKDANGANVKVVIDPVKKDVKMYQEKTVVEVVQDESTEITLEAAHKISKRLKIGSIADVEVKTKNFGRISAQTAKQVIIQGIREAERELMIKEYESKRDDILTALVTKVDPLSGNAVLEIGKNQATLIKSEQIPGEDLRVGDRIKVYVTEVKKETKGPIVLLSRNTTGIVKRLFELEIPEIQDGTVIIHSVSRDPGSRAKIAVYSRNADVDAIGSCIGPKGMRKANIMNELAGEKIDIVEYSEIPEDFIKAALSPATVQSVTITSQDPKTCKVMVANDQLSLAIGKKGQNAMLAAKLTGFKIDIKSPELEAKETASPAEDNQ
ncbi:MAG: transcription termination/antitermination protein NusA [Clostridia bacterium]|nr:transcription termination/antitermination protein NusA [Clostridia bacterium]